MIFATYWFLFSVAIFLPLYWLVRFDRPRRVILLLYCFVFHAHFAGAAGVIPIVVLALITFLIGRTRNKHLCILGMAVCVTALCFYKYSHFLALELIAHFDKSVSTSVETQLGTMLPATPPLAISFFTFEFVHYLYEVRKGGQAIRNLGDFCLFTFFFPSLVAGPIKRYQQFLPSIRHGLKNVSQSMVMLGILQVVSGYLKKILIADNLSAYIGTNLPFYNQLYLEDRWWFLLAIMLRIYFDFSGYSDIAIGLARMMGVDLPANFNWPYLATNIRDFWQRWHISLSTWIRDYVYIPLGGGHRGQLRRVINALIAFAICGLWHGPAWHFVVWGVYHGIGLMVSTVYRKLPFGNAIGFVFDKVPLLGWCVTMLFVAFGWLLFFYPLPQAFKMFCLLFEMPPA